MTTPPTKVLRPLSKYGEVSVQEVMGRLVVICRGNPNTTFSHAA